MKLIQLCRVASYGLGFCEHENGSVKNRRGRPPACNHDYYYIVLLIVTGIKLEMNLTRCPIKYAVR